MGAVNVDASKVHAFDDERNFEKWLGKNWNKEQEVWIKIHKVRSGLASITPAQAIDVALCWGWIDGIRKSYDNTSFLQRYTPRTKKSIWSQVNVANVERLIKGRRMQPPGLAQVEAAKADGRWAAAYSMTKSQAPPDLLAQGARDVRNAVVSKSLCVDLPYASDENRGRTEEEDRRLRRHAQEGQDDPSGPQGLALVAESCPSIWARRRRRSARGLPRSCRFAMEMERVHAGLEPLRR